MASELGDNSFADNISHLLKNNNTTEALALFTDDKNVKEIYNYSWDLVPIVGIYLTDDYKSNHAEIFKCCQKMIITIAEHSNAEEVLLQFIEEIELAKDDVKFLTLVKPLETVLLRVPDKRVSSLAWCFNAIKQYLQKVEIPEEEYELEDEERLLLDASDNANRVTNLYNELLLFSKTLIREVKDITTYNIVQRKQIIGKFLIDLLGKPFCDVNLDIYKNTKPQARIIAEEIVSNFFCLSLDPFFYLESHGNNYDLIKPKHLSLGMFYYLMLNEEICHQLVPKVYHPVYIFQNSLHFVNSLFIENRQFLVERGVHLTRKLLDSIDSGTMSYLLLDSKQHCDFCVRIANIIVHNSREQIRKKSLATFQKYLWSFEPQGRYLVIINIMNHISHSGLKGNIIMQYKAMITEEVAKGSMNHLGEFYIKQKLCNILDVFTFLKQKEETDLVNESDQIVSTLNLLRYLIIIDKNGITGIDDYITSLEEGYLKYLKTGITLSKEHYYLKIKEVKEENVNKKTGLPDCKVSVTVSNRNLLEMPNEQKIDVMNLSLTTLDVVDSLLSRLMECINMKRNCYE